MSATRKPRSLPLSSELGPTLERFRQMVAASQDALLTEGPVHADHELLDLCSEALHLLMASKRLRESTHKMHDSVREWTAADRAEFHASSTRWYALEKKAVPFMHRIRKLRATTPAGIYAKALIVRASVTGAAYLAKTLAEDLIACEGLRASLWPAEAVAR